MIGRVVSTKMKNTAVVTVERRVTHPLYKKSYRRSKKYFLEDTLGVKPGDLVEFIKIRPISKLKHWKVVKVLGSSIAEIASLELKAHAAKVIEEAIPVSPGSSQGGPEKETVESSVVSQQTEEIEVKKETKKVKKGSK